MTLPDTAPPAKKPALRRYWPVLVIVAGLAAAWALGLFDLLSLETLKAQQARLESFVANNFLFALIAYIGIYAAATFFMVPGALWITIAGGLLFGLIGGTLVTIAGATLGASLLFLAAKTSFGSSLQRMAKGYVEKVREEFHKSPRSYMFAMRFFPVMPFPIANIVPALLGARFVDYALTTALGIVPGVIAYTWVGAGLGASFSNGETPDLSGVFMNLLPAALALLALSLLPVIWKRVTGKQPPQIEETAQ